MKKLKGKVISVKMLKTVVVEVERTFKHPVYKKYLKRSKKYKVHNENIDLKKGDSVEIAETRPVSRHVHFQVVKKL